jgi:hypothetical protein
MDEIEDKELLIQRAVFGQEVEQFLSSYIGKYLLARAQEQVEVAQRAFRDVDVTDVARLTVLQNRINVASSIPDWLVDAINDGAQALQLIDDRG